MCGIVSRVLYEYLASMYDLSRPAAVPTSPGTSFNMFRIQETSWPWFLTCAFSVLVLLVKLLSVGRRPKDYPPGATPSKGARREEVLIRDTPIQVLQHYRYWAICISSRERTYTFSFRSGPSSVQSTYCRMHLSVLTDW